MQTIGERLEEARKRKGISIREAAEATKVRGDYLHKFESNQFDINLPEIYVRGFLRTYASYLKLPGDKLQPKDGFYELRITEELWEAGYFDHVELTAVDHPADVAVGERAYGLLVARDLPFYDLRLDDAFVHGMNAFARRIGILDGGQVPTVDPTIAKQTFGSMHAAIDAGLVRSCHDPSEGGLAVALAEMAFAGGCGASEGSPAKSRSRKAVVHWGSWGSLS